MSSVFDGHNDLLTRLWLSDSPNPVHDFIYTQLSGHLDFKCCQQAQWHSGLFSIFLPPFNYVKKHYPQKLKNPNASNFSKCEIAEICLAQLHFSQCLENQSEEQTSRN